MLTEMEGILEGKFEFPTVQLVFWEASSFHSDTRVHRSLTFTRQGMWTAEDKTLCLYIYQLIVFVTLN